MRIIRGIKKLNTYKIVLVIVIDFGDCLWCRGTTQHKHCTFSSLSETVRDAHMIERVRCVC